MKAMVLNRVVSLAENRKPLTLVELPEPIPGTGEILLKIATCGVCHTELDEIEGRTPPPRLPITPGHQIVGRVVQNGPGGSILATASGLPGFIRPAAHATNVKAVWRTCAASSEQPDGM